MNEDFLNSIRHDIIDPKLGAGIDDPVSNPMIVEWRFGMIFST